MCRARKCLSPTLLGDQTMTRKLIPLLTLACPLLFSSASAADKPVKLQFKMKKGQKLIYRSSSQVNKTEKLNGMSIKTDLNTNAITTRTFKGTDKKGNFKLETEMKKIKMTAEIGPLGKYTYDSTSSDNEKSSMLGAWFTPVLDTVVGATINVTIQPNGKVLPVKGYKELVAEAVKASPMKAQYTNEAYRVEFGESLVNLPAKPVKKGDTWSEKYEIKMPGVGTLKRTIKYTHAGDSKVGSRKTIKITAVYDDSIEVDIKRTGQTITGTLTGSDSKAVIHFDPVAGQLVSKTKTSKQSGTLTVDVGGMSIGVETNQSTTQKYELLDKLPK